MQAAVVHLSTCPGISAVLLTTGCYSALLLYFMHPCCRPHRVCVQAEVGWPICIRLLPASGAGRALFGYRLWQVHGAEISSTDRHGLVQSHTQPDRWDHQDNTKKGCLGPGRHPILAPVQILVVSLSTPNNWVNVLCCWYGVLLPVISPDSRPPTPQL